MKVCFVTREYPPNVYGGAGVHIKNLARELAAVMDVEVRCFGDQNEESEHLKVKAGVMDNKALSKAEVEDLAKMPSRHEMQAQIVGLAVGVAGRLISQFKGPAGRIVGAIDAKAKSEEAKA